MKHKPKPDGHGKADGKTDGKAKHLAKVTKFASDRPEARDEGPRLIPLDRIERTEHYGRAIDLADIALGTKKKHTKQHVAAPSHVTSHGQPAKSSTKGRSHNA